MYIPNHNHNTTTLVTHSVSLFIDIETFQGEPFTLKLQAFSVGDARSNYPIHFTGNSQSSDCVKQELFPSGDTRIKFSTRDADNDQLPSRNCASEIYRGGWWYKSCGSLSLNGDYEGDVTPTFTGILVRCIDTTSGHPSATKAVKSVEMIIRTRVE